MTSQLTIMNGKLRTGNSKLTTDFCSREPWQATALHRHADSFNQFPEQLLRLFGFLEGRRVAAVYRHAVGKDCHHQRLEVFRDTEVAATEKGHGLPSTVEHLGTAGGNPQGELLGLAGGANNRQHIANQRVIDPYLR